MSLIDDMLRDLGLYRGSVAHHAAKDLLGTIKTTGEIIDAISPSTSKKDEPNPSKAKEDGKLMISAKEYLAYGDSAVMFMEATGDKYWRYHALIKNVLINGPLEDIKLLLNSRKVAVSADIYEISKTVDVNKDVMAYLSGIGLVENKYKIEPAELTIIKIIKEYYHSMKVKDGNIAIDKNKRRSHSWINACINNKYLVSLEYVIKTVGLGDYGDNIAFDNMTDKELILYLIAIGAFHYRDVTTTKNPLVVELFIKNNSYHDESDMPSAAIRYLNHTNAECLNVLFKNGYSPNEIAHDEILHLTRCGGLTCEGDEIGQRFNGMLKMIIDQELIQYSSLNEIITNKAQGTLLSKIKLSREIFGENPYLYFEILKKADEVDKIISGTGLNLLELSFLSNDTFAVKYLIEKGFTVNVDKIISGTGLNLLELSFLSNDIFAVKYLVEKGFTVNVDKIINEIEPQLDTLTWSKYQPCIELLKKYDMKPIPPKDMRYDVEKIFTDNLTIDSNIWMNKKYTQFFEVMKDICKRKAHTLSLYGIQFDEICNIKNNSEYKDEKNKAARCALSRVDELQKENVLNVPDITMNTDRNAYADPVIIKVITSEYLKNKKCTLISDDVELCIRLRQKIKSISEANPSLTSECKIYQMDNIIKDAAQYIKYNYDIEYYFKYLLHVKKINTDEIKDNEGGFRRNKEREPRRRY